MIIFIFDVLAKKKPSVSGIKNILHFIQASIQETFILNIYSEETPRISLPNHHHDKTSIKKHQGSSPTYSDEASPEKSDPDEEGTEVPGRDDPA